MIREEIRNVIAQAEDFERRGDLEGAIARIEHALTLVQWLAASDMDLRDEVIIVRDRMVAAKERQEADTEDREAHFRVREANASAAR